MGGLLPGPVLGDVGFVTGGIVLLVTGAWAVVEAGSGLAKRMGVSPMWVGLTVVAFGTSLPELVVASMASVGGIQDLAVATVVGSNTLNVLIVLGATAAIASVPVEGITIRRDLAVVAVAGCAVWLLALDGFIHRGEGILMLAAMVPYVVHVYRAEKRGAFPVPVAPAGMAKVAPWVQVSTLVLGLVLLVIGGRALVEGGTSLAERSGLDQRVIGLTVVAIGTSMPELATSLVAAWRRQVDLALGNLIGSNIANLLIVLGTASVLNGQSVSPSIIRVDMPWMIVASFLLLRFAGTRGNVSRSEGVLLLFVYAVYLVLMLGGF